MKFASTKTFGRIQSKIQTLTTDQYSKRLSGLSIYFKYNAGSHSPPNERSTEKCAIYFIKESPECITISKPLSCRVYAYPRFRYCDYSVARSFLDLWEKIFYLIFIIKIFSAHTESEIYLQMPEFLKIKKKSEN